MHPAAVRLESVTVAFGSRTALRDIDLQLTAPTSVALVGPNGSGKTTLLRLVAGLLEPTDGSVIVDADGPPAFVPQQHHTRPFMPLTVREIVAMGRFVGKGLIGRLAQDDRDAIDRAAERAEVTDLLGRQFGELSGGQRQRVLVARALAQDSPILLLDEPITGLDLASQERILAIVDDEVDRGSLVLLSTHHLDEAHRCRQTVLLATHLVASGPASEVLVADHLRAAYGGRVITADAGTTVILDDHGHDHSH